MRKSLWLEKVLEVQGGRGRWCGGPKLTSCSTPKQPKLTWRRGRAADALTGCRKIGGGESSLKTGDRERRKKKERCLFVLARKRGGTRKFQVQHRMTGSKNERGSSKQRRGKVKRDQRGDVVVGATVGKGGTVPRQTRCAPQARGRDTGTRRTTITKTTTINTKIVEGGVREKRRSLWRLQVTPGLAGRFEHPHSRWKKVLVPSFRAPIEFVGGGTALDAAHSGFEWESKLNNGPLPRKTNGETRGQGEKIGTKKKSLRGQRRASGIEERRNV